MPPKIYPYGGFASLTEYLEARCVRERLTKPELSERLGKSRNYVSSICDRAGRDGRVHPPMYKPRPEMCNAIAELFGDEPHLVRVLAGIETAEPQLSKRRQREIMDLVATLGDEDLAFVVRVVRSLKDTQRRK